MKKDDLHISSLVHQLRHIDAKKRREALLELIILKEESALHSYIALLKDKDPEIRGYSARALGIIAFKESISPLVEALGDSDENVNYWIVYALSNIGSEEVFNCVSWALTDKKLAKYAFEIVSRLGPLSSTKLIEILCDKNWQVRSMSADSLVRIGYPAVSKLAETLHKTDNIDMKYWILKILGKIGDPESMNHIIKFLEFDNVDIRKAAIDALYLLGTDESINTLSDLIESEFEDVRLNAVLALGEIGSTYFEKILERFEDDSWVVRNAASKAATKCGDVVIPLLEGTLQEGNENQRFCCCKALGGFGKKGFRGLLKSLDDKTWAIRKLASDNLAKFGSDVTPYLLKLVISKKSPDEKKFWAIRTLGNIRDGSIVEKIIPFLKYPNKDIRFATVRALGKIGDKSIVPRLINTLHNQDEETRYWSIKALGEIGPEAIKGLMEKLSDNDWNVRRIASQAIGEIGESSVLYLVKGMKHSNSDTRYWSRKAMVMIGFKACDEIVKLLKNKSWNIRKEAADAIGEIGSVAIPKLIAALKTGNEHFRHWIPKIIGNMYSKVAITELVEFLKTGDKEERILALKAISDIGNKCSEEVETLVIDCLQDEFWEVRQEAATAIGLLKIKNGGAELISALIDSDPILRGNAALSIGLIGDLDGLELLFDILDDPDRIIRIKTIKALGLLKSDVSIEKICKILENSELEVTNAAIWALGEIGSKEKIELIFSYFGNNLKTDMYIVETLGKIKTEISHEKLVTIIFNEENDRILRAKALEALISLNPKNIHEYLNKLLNDRNWHVRKIAFKEIYKKKSENVKEFTKLPKKKTKENRKGVNFYNEGITFYKNGQIEKAMSAFKNAIEQKPDFKEPYIKLIQICIENSFIKTAKSYIKLLLGIDKNDENALLSYGYILFLEKNVEKAKKILSKVVKFAKKDSNKVFAQKLIERLK
ncbi:HEAT repeat domain-containing protein [bacterium]|nr:HEAT repeat domain-containing protein [bacterium]